MVRELCIIGFGVSGIACLRWSKLYNIDAVVFEKNDKLGGVWHSISYQSTILQSQKQSYSFSDIPMSKHTSDYPTRDEITDYLKSYCDYHDLIKNVYFNQNIESIYYNENTELWEIDILNLKSLKTYQVKSKYLAICSGFYNKPNIPIFHNQENYKGIITHSKEFSKIGKYTIKDFKDKKVVFIGNGPSACDLACDAVKNGAKEVTILYRSNRWFFKRYYWNVSGNYILNRLFLNIAVKCPLSIFLALFYVFYIIPAKLYGVNVYLPNEKINRNNLTLNEDIFEYIKHNLIDYRKNTVKSFKSNSLILNDDTKLDCEMVVLCTGFKQNIPFLKLNKVPLLYKRIIPMNMPNCGFIGFAPSFNWVQVADLQSRWFLNYIKYNINISKKQMLFDIFKTKKNQDEVNLEYFDLSYQPFEYLDNLAKDLNIDIKKNMFDLIETPRFDKWGF